MSENPDTKAQVTHQPHTESELYREKHHANRLGYPLAYAEERPPVFAKGVPLALPSKRDTFHHQKEENPERPRERVSANPLHAAPPRTQRADGPGGRPLAK